MSFAEMDNDAFDALQLAVQLHSERYRYNETEARLVLADADLFLVWLQGKKQP